MGGTDGYRGVSGWNDMKWGGKGEGGEGAETVGK